MYCSATLFIDLGPLTTFRAYGATFITLLASFSSVLMLSTLPYSILLKLVVLFSFSSNVQGVLLYLSDHIPMWKYEKIWGKYEEICGKYAEICGKYAEMCEKYEKSRK